jgi:NSS family neurotransmitter:Na+ symporter
MSYSYGGGAFLVAWMIGLIVMGVPWLIMEFGMGRYFQKGAPGAFGGVRKRLEWVGWWPVFVAFLIVSYYTVIMAWSLHYAIGSLSMAWGAGEAGAANAGDYFFSTVLQLSDGPGTLGAPIGSIVLALAAIWVILYFIMWKGAGQIGKIAIWTVLIPWVLLVALLIRGLTLPGAVQGLNYYLTPDFSQLARGEIWFAALSQIAFTLSVGMAGMYAYGSFVAKKADINNNAFITSFSNCATSFFAGFAVFSTVGFIMQALSIPIEEVSASGLGLAFVSFPVGISMIPVGGQFVGFLFFICLFFLGIDSAFFLAHGGVIAPLCDKFGMRLKRGTLIVCIIGFVVGLLFTTRGGLYWLDIVDRMAAFYGLLITGAIASIVVGWVFPASRLREHVNETSDFKIGAWFDWMLKIVVPLGAIFVVVYGGFMKDFVTPYGGYPMWAAAFVWILLAVTFILSWIFQGFKTREPRPEKARPGTTT